VSAVQRITAVMGEVNPLDLTRDQAFKASGFAYPGSEAANRRAGSA
jgi:hypothetical protein